MPDRLSRRLLLAVGLLGILLGGQGQLSGQQRLQQPNGTGPGETRPNETGLRPVWLDLPFVAQTPDGCGSASLAMVMRYWQREQHLPMTAEAGPLQQKLFSRSAHGIPASRMVSALQQAGFAAYVFHGQWSDLEHHLALGRPLIAAVRDGGRHGPLHYVVLAGVGSDAVYLNDPARQRLLRLSRTAFLDEWSATDDWTLLAVPRAAAPAAAR